MTDDGPVYHTLSVQLSRAKSITRLDARYAVAKFSKSRVWSKVPEGISLPLFLEIHEFPCNTVYDRSNEDPLRKPARFVQPFRQNTDPCPRLHIAVVFAINTAVRGEIRTLGRCVWVVWQLRLAAWLACLCDRRRTPTQTGHRSHLPGNRTDRIPTATPDTTKPSCLCRVWRGGVNWTIAFNVFRLQIFYRRQS